MSVTEYKLEELLLYEELEKLREQYGERELLDNIVIVRKIEDLLRICGKYIRKAKKVMRAYT